MLAFALITVFISLNALYVAAEFSAVASRCTRLQQMAEEGDKKAAWMFKTCSDAAALDRYVAAAQLGITVSSLSMGFYGQTFLAPVLEPLLAHTPLPPESAPGVALALILLLLTGLQVILGELVPKSLGIGYPEKVSRYTVAPMRLSIMVFSPLITVFNGSANFVLGLFGASHGAERDKPKTADEIRMLAGESHSGGVLDDVEYELLDNALRLRDLTAQQVMLPRMKVMALPASTSLADALRELAESHHSRAPVYGDSLDQPLGLVHVKDLLSAVRSQSDSSLKEILRPLPVVPGTITVRHLFRRLQNDRFHMAIVADEYGGTSGIVTIEDLIERIFGDVADEFDPVAEKPYRVLGEKLLIPGTRLLVDFNDDLELTVTAKDSNTVAGLVMEARAGLPEVGERVEVGQEVEFIIEEADARSVGLVGLQVSSDTLERLREEGLL